MTEKESMDLEEDGVDYDKPMFWQVDKLGPAYMDWVHRPRYRAYRMFEWSFFEVFSKTEWWVVPLVWLPIFALWSLRALQQDPSWLEGPLGWLHSPAEEAWEHGLPLSPRQFLLLGGCGALSWTLLE